MTGFEQASLGVHNIASASWSVNSGDGEVKVVSGAGNSSDRRLIVKH